MNAKTWARPFTARLLEPGLVSYEDQGCGIALLRKETIDKYINTFVGRPLVCLQNARGQLIHTKTSPANMKAIGHGYIHEVFFNSSDGWWYGKGLADTDEAVRAIQDVKGCSTGYKVEQARKAAANEQWHSIPFDEEITAFSGEHLAIVGNPRYEESTIRLNSKNQPQKIMSLFKWNKKPAPADDAAKKAADDKAAAEAAARENAKSGEEISGDTTFDIPTEDGKTETVSINQLIADRRENAKKENAAEMDGDDEVVCNGLTGDMAKHNGKTYKMNALLQAFDKWEVKNAMDEEEKTKKENAKRDADAAAQRERDEAAARGQKPNTNHFRIVENAAQAGVGAVKPARKFGTLEERIAEGSRQYGSKKTA